MPLISSLLVGRGGADLGIASAMVREVGVAGICTVFVAAAVRVSAFAVRSNDYRSDDRTRAVVVECMNRSGANRARRDGVGEKVEWREEEGVVWRVAKSGVVVMRLV